MMHAVILRPPPGRVADHINHNGLDNRRANLRIATLAQNARNCRQNKKGKSSKYRGVWHNKQNKKWRATIVFNRKRRQIGYFKKETDAAKAYDVRELYTFIVEQIKATPYIPINPRNQKDDKTFGPHGCPLCDARLEMKSAGKWKEGNRDRIRCYRTFAEPPDLSRTG